MTSINKTLFSAAAVGAMALASATPALANDRHRDRGIDGDDILTGALIIGGIAAIAAIADGDDDDRYDNRRYRDRNYRDRNYRNSNYGDRYDSRRNSNRHYNHGTSERAVESCIRAAERRAERWTGGRAQVTQIRDVDRERRGFEVKGRIAVRDTHSRSSRRNAGWDEGRFTCDFRSGQVVDVRFRGIRNL